MCPGSSITRIYFASQQTIAIHYLLINSRILNHIHTSEQVEFKAGFRPIDIIRKQLFLNFIQVFK